MKRTQAQLLPQNAVYHKAFIAAYGVHDTNKARRAQARRVSGLSAGAERSAWAWFLHAACVLQVQTPELPEFEAFRAAERVMNVGGASLAYYNKR